jgi:hypothetical protein
METLGQAPRAVPATRHSAPGNRVLLAWALMIGGLIGFWCLRPWLGIKAFSFGQLGLFLLIWKVASLLCLPPGAWARFTPLRFLAYWFWYGMQPRQFLKGEVTAAGAPVPTVTGILLNALAGATLLWLVPYLLPAVTPWTVRFWIALVGASFLTLFARLDVAALIFRAMGFPVEKLMDCPVAAPTLADFWGRRWNRIVSGMLREVIFFPVARWAGARVALLAVFLYSGLYHEGISFMAGSGYGAPSLYFLLQYLGVLIENTDAARRLRSGRPWLGRAWAWAVVLLPINLFLTPGLVDRVLVPLLVQTGVRGLER